MTEESLIKKLKIVAIRQETPGAKTFVVNYIDHEQPLYKPGQFITLVFYTKHGEKRRSYSITSTPVLNEPLSFTVKKVDNGEFSRLLIFHAGVGDILYTSGIGGLFLLPANPDDSKQYFFIAAGSGITPCFPMIKTILTSGIADVVLIYSNRNLSDCIFYYELNELQECYSARFRIRYLFSDILDVYQSRLSKWLLQQLLDEYLTVQDKSALFYLCGPFEYMRMAEITLLDRIPAKNIMKENFNILPHVMLPAPPDKNAYSVTISINNQKHIINVQYPKSILATAKANKINLPYSCEAGRCGSCIATCIQGKIWMAYNEVLTDDEIDNGKVLTCQGYPIYGDAEIVI